MKTLAVLIALSIFVAGATSQTTFTVTNQASTAYLVNGEPNTPLDLTRGETYVFDVHATGHPFYIKTQRVTGSGSQYTSGVSGQPATNGMVTFVVPADAPNTLFYQCGNHGLMGGDLNITGTVADVPEDVDPSAVWLSPAAPNPMQTSTRLRFGLPRDAAIELSLFDARGRRIRQLIHGTWPAGEHSMQWDGRDQSGHLAPNGIYYCRLKVQDQLVKRTITIAR